MANKKLKMQAARKARIRNRVTGTPERPRLTVFRSNFEIYVQVIDDESGNTLVAASSIDKQLKPLVGELRANPPKPEIKAKAELATAPAPAEGGKGKKAKAEKPVEAAPKKEKGKAFDSLNVLIARKVGEAVAKRCQEKGIDKVVFDRNGYKYHGRVKELADAARKAGLNF